MASGASSRPAWRTTPGGSEAARRCSAGDQHLVDDVDDAVGRGDVGRGDACAADEDLAVADANADSLAVERLDRVALDDLGGGQLALGDVVEQNRTQLGLVLGERVQRLRG